jgi:hypothetical protein
VSALAERIKPSKLIIHYLASNNMAKTPNSFLKRRFAPLHVHQLTVNISRHVSYEHQCKLAIQEGIELLEVRTNPPSMGPNRLRMGPAVYDHARQATIDYLSRRYQS